MIQDTGEITPSQSRVDPGNVVQTGTDSPGRPRHNGPPRVRGKPFCFTGPHNPGRPKVPVMSFRRSPETDGNLRDTSPPVRP